MMQAYGNLCADREGLSLCCDRSDVQIASSACVRLHKRVETLLRSLRIEGASARKANAFTQRDAPGQRILLRDRFRQPGLQLHLVCETE